jgi:hypothetical protein
LAAEESERYKQNYENRSLPERIAGTVVHGKTSFSQDLALWAFESSYSDVKTISGGGWKKEIGERRIL